MTVSNASHTTLATGESGNLTLKPSSGDIYLYNKHTDNSSNYKIYIKNDDLLYYSEGSNEYLLSGGGSAPTASSSGSGDALDLIGTDIDVWAISADQKDIYTYHNVNVRSEIIFGDNEYSFNDNKRKVRLYVNDENELYFNDGQSDVKLTENNSEQLVPLSWDVSNDLEETSTNAKVVSKGELAINHLLYATGLSNVVSGSATFTASSNTITSQLLIYSWIINYWNS